MLKNKKATFFVSLVLVVVLIVLGIWIGFWVSGQRSNSDNMNAASPYTAVYLTSGDIYFGKLSHFPRLHLTGAWYLQRGTAQNGQPQFGVAPFTSAVWGPVGDIYINAQNVLFYAPLRNGSELVQAIEKPSSVQQQAAGQQQVPSPVVTSTSTAPTAK